MDSNIIWQIIGTALVAPAFTVMLLKLAERKRLSFDRKYEVFKTLIVNRHNVANEEMVKAYNQIDFLFSKDTKQLWHNYYDMLCLPMKTENEFKIRDVKRLEVLNAMAKEIGLGRRINYLDINRVYFPQALSDEEQYNAYVKKEWTRILGNSHSFAESIKIPEELNKDV